MNHKILFIGGGSGGHMMPLIPLMKRLPDSYEIHFLTGHSQLESDMILDNFSDIPLTHHQIKTGKMRAYLSFKNFTDIPRILFSIFKSYRLLRTLNPSVIFFKGGSIGFPMTMALKFERLFNRKRKIFLHESDITPGKLYKMIEPMSGGLFKNFGNHPLFYYEPSPRPLGEESGVRVKLLIFAGSQGAQWINEAIGSILNSLTEKYDVTLITGPGKSIEVEKDTPHFTQHESLPQSELFQAIAKADLVVSRSGSSLFQVLYLQKKLLLIPLPGSARDHQTQNAQYFAHQHLCHLFDQSQHEPSDLFDAIETLKADEKLSHKLKEPFIKPAEDRILKVIEKALEEREK